MGHQFARATPAAAVAVALVGLATACGGGDAGPPPVLDNAREQVEAVATSTVVDGESASSDLVDETEDSIEVPAELPAPDPSTFEGANRVVNLWVGEDGETAPIDVWGRRTFTNGPLLLAEEVGFGQASGYVSAPPEYSLVVVNAGAGPDGDERAGLLNAVVGEQITTIYTNADSTGTVSAPNYFEAGSTQAPTRPAADRGLVWLIAPNVRAFSERMIEVVGGDAFYVGDGSESCRRQRIEDAGMAPSILGGTQWVELELEPGPATISLHPWFSADECAQPATLEFAVDVVAGATTLVVVFTRDGTSVETLTLPVNASD